MSFVVFNSSAGSGKTFTLVKQYLILALSAEDINPFRHILAMTFTNKAAAEMKSRVLQVLISIMNGEVHPMKNDLKEHLNLDDDILKLRCEHLFFQMLHHYSDFNIGTIDKFMHKVIRTFARDLRLPLNFEVELEEDQLVIHSVSTLLNRVGNDKLLTEVLLKFSMEKYEEGKSWSLDLDLRNMTSSLMKDIPPVFLNFLEGVDAETLNETFQQLRKSYMTQKKDVQSIGKTYFELLRDHKILPDEMAGGKNGLSKYFEYLSKGMDEKWIPGIRVSKYAAEGKWSASKTDSVKKDTISSIESEINLLYAKAQIFVDREYGNYIFRKLVLSKMYQLILFNEIQTELSSYKTENNIVHISDFNKAISKIVSTEPAPFIYERLGEKYRHYLIDEFQDTSVLQWQNLLPLVENSLASGNQVILVGDGKQAIYRWRGGEVEQFSLMPKIHPDIFDELSKERAVLLESSYHPKNLAVNYRSAKDIVNFNNALYTRITEYLPDHLRDIYDGLQQTPSSTEGGYVKVQCYPEELELDFDHWNVLQVHQEIQRSIEKGFALSDIAILCVKRSETIQVAEYLTEQGIEMISEESLLLRNDLSVGQLILLLQIMNAKDSASFLAGVYLLSEQLYEQNSALLHPSELHDAIVNEDILFEEWIESMYEGMNWNFLHDKPIMEILEHFVRICKMDSSSPPILTFLDNVLKYIRRNGENLNGLLQWWENNKEKLAISIPDGVNAVQIMTIHKSKGLEFPVVIFPFISNTARITKKELWMTISDDTLNGLPLALLPMNKQLEHTPASQLYQQEMNRSLLDRVNLLYVATTRAINRLVLLTETGKQKNDWPMAGIISDFCTSSSQMNTIEGGFQFGKDEHDVIPKENTIQQMKLSSINTKTWRKKLVISVHSKFEQELSKQEDPRQFGILLHHLMSKFNKKAEALSEINRLKLAGEISNEESAALETHVENIFRLEKMAVAREVQNEWNERELLSKEGTIYRPDKVVETSAGFVLIDYKSGDIKEDHKTQLNEYARTLQEMNCTIKGKFLIYSGPGKLMEV